MMVHTTESYKKEGRYIALCEIFVVFTFAFLYVTNNLLNILTPLQTVKNKNTAIKKGTFCQCQFHPVVIF